MQVKRDAKFSKDRKYRYVLDREWDASGKLVTFVMLNPSCADEVVDDQTITRCIGFAKTWGYGRLKAVNLFAWRATDSNELSEVDDPVGKDNDPWIPKAVKQADKVVCAWGDDISKVTDGEIRVKKVLELIRLQDKTLYRLGSITKKGNPRHPSRLGSDTELQPWNPTL